MTLGGGGGGGEGVKGYDAKKMLLSISFVFILNTEHLASCSVDSSGSSYIYSDYTFRKSSER